MLEKNEVINKEDKNPNSEIESLDNLKQNLIEDISEEKDSKNNTKENESTEQEEKDENLSIERLNKNNIDNNENKENKIKEDLDTISFYSNIIGKNELFVHNSTFDRESLYNTIKKNNSEMDKKKNKFNINKKLLKKIMIVIEIFFGSLLGSSCILILIMLIEEKITHQKISNLFSREEIRFNNSLLRVSNAERSCVLFTVSEYTNMDGNQVFKGIIA